MDVAYRTMSHDSISHDPIRERHREKYMFEAFLDRRHWTEDTLAGIERDMATVRRHLLSKEEVREQDEVDAHKRQAEQNVMEQRRDASSWIKRAVLRFINHPPEDVHPTHQTPMVDTVERYDIDWETPSTELTLLFNSIAYFTDAAVYFKRVGAIISILESLRQQIEDVKPLSAKQIEYSDIILALKNDWYLLLSAM